jgi:hypothetical protein
MKRPHDVKVMLDGERRREYRVRVERALGRRLKRTECVHHHSEQQLVACQDQGYHLFLHARTRVVQAGGDPNTQRMCGRCQTVKNIQDFSPRAHNPRSYECKACRRQYELRRYYERQGRTAP